MLLISVSYFLTVRCLMLYTKEKKFPTKLQYSENIIIMQTIWKKISAMNWLLCLDWWVVLSLSFVVFLYFILTIIWWIKMVSNSCYWATELFSLRALEINEQRNQSNVTINQRSTCNCATTCVINTITITMCARRIFREVEKLGEGRLGPPVGPGVGVWGKARIRWHVLKTTHKYFV